MINNNKPYPFIFNKPVTTAYELREFLNLIVDRGDGDIPVYTKGDDGYDKIRHIEEEITDKGLILVLGQNLQYYS